MLYALAMWVFIPSQPGPIRPINLIGFNSAKACEIYAHAALQTINKRVPATEEHMCTPNIVVP